LQRLSPTGRSTASGNPQLVVEEMTREQARLFSRLKLGDLIPH
jgi:hypothetical protein